MGDVMRWDPLGDDDIPIHVCVTHARFLPCRSQDGRCIYTSNEHAVNAVRDYQQDVIHDWYVPW